MLVTGAGRLREWSQGELRLYRLPNEKTYNPLRKPSPRKTPRETASHAAQYYTAAIQNATFKANHIHRSVI